jgi:2-polyprenyl-6-methoxyphenol hydroxylase-like FAD-dependent oxidoreductase
MSGMGTSIAMVGAYLLAWELRAAGGDYASAFAKYEGAMREFVSEAQKMAESVEWFIPNQIQIVVQHQNVVVDAAIHLAKIDDRAAGKNRKPGGFDEVRVIGGPPPASCGGRQ